jgi:hypothetical protein
VKTLMGGGWPSTELRQLSESKVFDWFDGIVLDEGREPLARWARYIAGELGTGDLARTYIREAGKVRLVEGDASHCRSFKDQPAPTMEGLPLDRYMAVCEVLNPMHRLWSSTRWNKLMAAHGCYWKKCAFCDTSLDYIARFEPLAASRIVDHMEALIGETGQTGFHFADEALPPKLARELSEEILRRGLTVSWWGNLRFDKAFDAQLVALMRRSGCIAVTGGLEAASDRVLDLMNKGVRVDDVARVTRTFVEHGILTHAYLIYGFPTMSVQETVDALERVRQMFSAGCLHSAYWHRFALTAHSPVAKDPGRFGVRLLPEGKVTFARNEIPYEEVSRSSGGIQPSDLERLGEGLHRAVYHFMHGIGLEDELRQWLGNKVPRTTLAPDWIDRALG